MAGTTRENSQQVLADMREFDKVAVALGMPNTERLSILGLTNIAYEAWQSNAVDPKAQIAPEFVRRLGYALPLMRRMAANQPMLPASRRLETSTAASQANGSGTSSDAVA